MMTDRYFARTPLIPGLVTERGWTCPNTIGAIAWNDANRNLQSAQVRLDIGGDVYLTVECLGRSGWDWLVWDESCQFIPRYGVADTDAAARHQAELMVTEVAILLGANSSLRPERQASTAILEPQHAEG